MRRHSLIAYVGARTTSKRNARGNGLNVYHMNSDLEWSHLQLLEMENPSFLAFDRTGRFLYSVHGDSDRVSSFVIDEQTAKLTFLNEQSTRGRNPVHLSLDPSNEFLIVANHSTSSLVVLPRREDGSLEPVCELASITGENGPHRIEQPLPKPHQVEFDPSGRWIVVPDKGTDSVLVFSIDRGTGSLRQVSSCAAREASGPRHVAFHPGGKLAYVINELDSTITAYTFDPDLGQLTPFQIVSALPETFTANSRASEIAVSTDGRFVYASNRGSDTIAAFAVSASGHLRLIGHWSSAGRTPRFFALPRENLLVVANEDSDSIVTFDLDQSTGQLSPRAQTLSVGSPVCIVTRSIEVD